MQLFYIVLAVIVSAAIAYFQYYFRAKKTKYTLLLSIIKFTSVLLLLIIFINPKITSKTIENQKPKLNVLIDNSLSINYFNAQDTVKTMVAALKNQQVLNDKFDLQYFTFGEKTQNLDSLNFTDKNSNLFVALDDINKLNKQNAPILMLTDGNQTIGPDYEFFKSKNAIYPVLVGDTTSYIDLKINQINVNKYSFINNQFPVEVLLSYKGKTTNVAQFTITKNGKLIFKKNLTFSESKNSEIIEVNIDAKKEGTHYYTAKITPLVAEKNKQNNQKSFSVEVINEQTKLLLLTSVLHPDIGAYKKAITSNKQNSVDVSLAKDFKGNLLDYQLILLYQPDESFNTIIDAINKNYRNFLFISGTNTNWNFINKKSLGIQKNAIAQTENYGAEFNENYLVFLQENISFNSFAPLTDNFGKVTIAKKYQSLLWQNINGIATKNPLIGTFQENDQKVGFILGENIWRWRANSYLKTNSFQEFDGFVGNMIQFLASTKQRNRLEVNTEPIFNVNENVVVTAFYTDENYKFDNRANLELSLTNTTTLDTKKIPFSLNATLYQATIENLPSGNYNYTVEVMGQKISKSGKFRVTDFSIEEQFTNANAEKLIRLAKNNEGKLYYNQNFDALIKSLINNDKFYTIQKKIAKEKRLIDWQWVLSLAFILLGFEWFLRKYLGKI